MAKIYITVYARLAHDGGNATVLAPQTPPLLEGSLEVGAKSTQSEPFPPQATFICIKAEANCCLAFGVDPKAVSGVHPVEAGERLWYGVIPGQKLAVIVE